MKQAAQDMVKSPCRAWVSGGDVAWVGLAGCLGLMFWEVFFNLNNSVVLCFYLVNCNIYSSAWSLFCNYFRFQNERSSSSGGKLKINKFGVTRWLRGL